MKHFVRKNLVALLLTLSTFVTAGCCWGTQYELKIPDEFK